jgi:hypothetical protein
MDTMSPAEEERVKLVLDLIDRMEAAVGDAPQTLKVLVGLRFAAIWSIANGVDAERFQRFATQVFVDTAQDMVEYAKAEEAKEAQEKADPP